MNFVSYHFLPFCFIALLYISGNLVDGYLMPICSEYGGICNRQSEEDRNKNTKTQMTKTSELFFFVMDTMDVVRSVLYNKVLPLLLYQKSEPQDTSYVDSMWTFFGFHVESEPAKDEEFPFCNGSIFALIFVLYFGYLFMATKCVNVPKYRFEEAETKFIPYLASNEDDEFPDALHKHICCHHPQEMDAHEHMCMLPYDPREREEDEQN